LLLLPAAARSQATADAGGMTLAQFRAAVEARLLESARTASRSREKPPPPDLGPAEETFAELLLAQAGQAAAQQSLDRLSGWGKAIQARLEAQSAPELDLETIRFAEARMTAESARFDRRRAQAAAAANALLGRPAEAPLTALLPSGSREASNEGGKAEGDLLAQGRELLAKMYQSYSFGGTPLSALLWQEQQVYAAELAYRAAMGADGVPISEKEGVK
jgi:outer membrane protein TolC